MSQTSLQAIYRSIPAVEEVVNYPVVTEYGSALPRDHVVSLVRETLDSIRAGVRTGEFTEITPDLISSILTQQFQSLQLPSLRRVINATGVVLHTNLGRSPLAEAAVEAVASVARGYSTLEYNVSKLARGSRHDHCEKLLCELTGAEAAMAVNNNAAAVMMVLAEFAAGKSAIVSRGELVEIGGSFRAPDIMEASRAKMVEVGTTNKTHAWDYERALTDDVSMLLKVHPSNYRTVGFTESVSMTELRRIADKENERRRAVGNPTPVLVYEDQGSGSLLFMECFGTQAEPTVAESLRGGVDLISFSGDKLLGGPQAGIIVGSKEHIARLKRNPLARALRLDKMTLAALETTLRIYLDPKRAWSELPTLRMLSTTKEEVQSHAEELSTQLQIELSAPLSTGKITIDVTDEVSAAGGGALPLSELETSVVRIKFAEEGEEDRALYYLANKRDTPIICRCKHQTLMFDARTLLPGDDSEIIQALKAYFEC